MCNYKELVKYSNPKILVEYLGSRNTEAVYKTNEGKLINSDVNGACNIIRKYKCKSGGDLSLTDVSGVINHPVRINPTKPTLL